VPTSERGHGVSLDYDEQLDGEGSVNLDRVDPGADAGDPTDVSTADSLGNMVVFNKLDIDKYKADKKHKKAPYVRACLGSATGGAGS
jgi:hypothetical protein